MHPLSDADRPAKRRRSGQNAPGRSSSGAQGAGAPGEPPMGSLGPGFTSIIPTVNFDSLGGIDKTVTGEFSPITSSLEWSLGLRRSLLGNQLGNLLGNQGSLPLTRRDAILVEKVYRSMGSFALGEMRVVTGR